MKKTISSRRVAKVGESSVAICETNSSRNGNKKVNTSTNKTKETTTVNSKQNGSIKPTRKTRLLKTYPKQQGDEQNVDEVTPPKLRPNHLDTVVGIECVERDLNEESPALSLERRIKEIFRDDFLCSQNAAESLCDVRWDCTSPDAIRQAMKRTSRKTQAVSELAQRLKVSDDELNSDEPEVKVKSLLGLWQPNIGDLGGQSKRAIRKRHAGKKKRKPMTITPELTETYRKWLAELEDLQKSENNPDTITSDDNVSKKNLSDDQGTNIFSDEDILLPTGVIKCGKNSSSDGANDTWSDDDLFNEDSFLMQASQMPENRLEEICRGNKRKRESLDLTGKPTKDSRIISLVRREVTDQSRSILHNENLLDANNNNRIIVANRVQTSIHINPNNASQRNEKYQSLSKQKLKMTSANTSTINDDNQNIKTDATRKSISDSTSVLSRNSFYGATKSPFRKHNSFSGSSNYQMSDISPSITSCGSAKLSETVKSPFRKHRSFDMSQHLTSTPTGKSWVKRERLKTSTITSVSTSNLQLAKSSNQMPHINKAVNVRMLQNAVHVMPKITEEAKNCVVNGDKTNCVKSKLTTPKSMNTENFLDTSISDEILRQLAEPDENLESQLTPEAIISPPEKNQKSVTVDNVNMNETFCDMFDDDFSLTDIDIDNNSDVKKDLQKSACLNDISNNINSRQQIIKPLSNTCSILTRQTDKNICKPRLSTALNSVMPQQNVDKPFENVAGNNNVLISLNVDENSGSDLFSNNFSSSIKRPSYNTALCTSNVSDVSDSVAMQPKMLCINKTFQNTAGSDTNVQMNSTKTTNTRPSQNKFSFKKKSAVCHPSKSNQSKSTTLKPTSSVRPINGINQMINDCFSAQLDVGMTQELFTDDSFSCDDLLIESQILAELDKIESSLHGSKK